jgi:hypothetical protein
MRPRRLTSLVAAVTIIASCTSGDASSNGTPSGAAAGDTARPESAVPWFPGVEPMLLAPGEGAERALVVAADSLAPDLEDGELATPVTLVRLDGTTAAATVTLSSSSEGCVDGVLAPTPARAWGIAFVGGNARGVPADSLRSLSPQDSAALTPMIFRLASAIPNPAGGRFSGLPFSLVDLWRVRLADGSTLVVAVTKRQINQEDSPLEERTLLVAQSEANDFAVVHSSRSSGPEETVEGAELMAVVEFSPGATLLVFGHDFGDERAYSILERNGSRTWAQRWTSRRFSC